MITVLLIFFLLFLVVTVVGVFVPKARLAAIATISVLLYLPSAIVWWFLLYVRYVDFDKLIAPYRWTQHGRTVEQLWFFGPPLIPSAILLLSCVGRYVYRMRRAA
jgi:uncharacterized membrane protein YqjE